MGDSNPRQFASSDTSGLGGSLTNRPPSSVSIGDPIDFEAINRQVINARTQPDYVYKESAVESTLRRQQDIAASLRIKQEYADQQTANALQRQGEQAQRRELANRISNSPTSPEVAQPSPESPLEAPPPSTLNRQTAPSTGRLPATPNGTAARADSLVEPTATPRPAMLREAIGNTVSGIGQSLPKSLPQAAGRFIVPGVGAGLTFVGALIAGQSVQQAATTTAVVTASSYAGGLIGTAIAGPVGFYVGAMIGGFAGGYLANAFFPADIPSPSEPKIEPVTGLYPFLGGQGTGTAYDVLIYKYDESGAIVESRQFGAGYVGGSLNGPIVGIEEIGTGAATVSHLVIKGGGRYIDLGVSRGWRIDSIKRSDGNLDYSSNPPAFPIAPDIRTSESIAHPGNQDYAVPSGIPQPRKDRPLPAIGISGGKNIQATPRGDNPNLVGHGGLAPSYLPNPNQIPSNLGGMLPRVSPAPAPPPFAEPKDLPSPRFAPAPGGSASSDPGGSESPSAYPGVSTIQNGVVTSPPILTAQPIPLNSSPLTTPTTLPRTIKQNPTADANSPVPKAQVLPTPKTPEAAAQQQKKDFDEQITRLTTIAGLIAGLTPIVQGIPDAIAKSPTVQAANKKTTQGAVCEIAQPGGCLGDALDNNADKINQNNNQNKDTLLDKISAGSNAAQLALLDIINNKLGDQVVGGISKFMENIAKNTYVEKALTYLTFIISLHNGLMLSNNLAQTLGGIINTALGLILPKGLDGTSLDINQILGKAAHEIIADTIGEANYTKLTEDWAKANRIYQASTNVLNKLTNFSATIMSGLEVIGGTLGKVSNALKKWGVVGEKAYEWFNPQPNFHNKAFVFLENANNEANTIQNVVNIPVSIGQAKTDLDNSVTELQTSIKGDKTPGIAVEENKPKKDEFDLGKSISQNLDLALDDIFDGSD